MFVSVFWLLDFVRGMARRFRALMMRRNRKCKLGTDALMSATEPSTKDQMAKLAKFPWHC